MRSPRERAARRSSSPRSDGYEPPDNARYEVRIEGLVDASGNVPVDREVGIGSVTDGALLATRFTRDTAAPSTPRLVVDGEPTGGRTLTRGLTYTLGVAASDARDETTRRTVRISADGGRTFGAPIRDRRGIEYPVLTSADRLVIRLRAEDEAGNATETETRVPIIDPTLEVSALVTEPERVEESSVATLRFGLVGDTALLSSVDVLTHDVWRAATLATRADGSTEALVRVEQPTLESLGGARTVPVTLRATLANGQVLLVERSHELHEDATVPEIAIVAPVDGAAIPTDSPTIVTLRSFDARGIGRVEARIGDEPVRELADIDRLELVATGTEPVTVSVRAIDLAGNPSAWASATYRPYDAGEGVPLVRFLAPANNEAFRERETIGVHARLVNVDEAKLYLDPAGVPSTTPVATIRAPSTGDGAVRTELALPAVDTTRFYALRLEANGARAVRYFNLVDDDAVEASASIETFPPVSTLAGSDVWVWADVADRPEDLADASRLVVEDPSGTPVLEVDVDGQYHRLESSIAADPIALAATLVDRSGNVERTTATLARTPFLAGTEDVLATDLDAAGARFVGMVALPGRPDGDVLWARNAAQAGFSLHDATGPLYEGETGRLESIGFSGRYLHAVATEAGRSTLLAWPITEGALGEPVRAALPGTLVGANGALFHWRRGRELGRFALVDEAAVPLVGHLAAYDVADAALVADRLVVLGGGALTVLAADPDRPGHLAQSQRIAVETDADAALFATDVGVLLAGADAFTEYAPGGGRRAAGARSGRHPGARAGCRTGRPDHVGPLRRPVRRPCLGGLPRRGTHRRVRRRRRDAPRRAESRHLGRPP